MAKYERIKCVSCDQTFGQEAKFLDHLTDVHGISDHLHLYLSLHHNGIHPTCQCKEACDKLLPWAGWKKGFTSKFSRGHNAVLDSVFADKERQAAFVQKRTEGYASGRNKVWNAGLTKETDERVMSQSVSISKTLKDGYESGSIKDWHAVEPERAKEAFKKSSVTKKQKHASGETVPWNVGLTKHTDERLSEIAKKISIAANRRENGRRISVDDLIARVSKFVDFVLLTPPEEYKTRRIERLQFKHLPCGLVVNKSLAMLEDTPVCFTCHPKESKGQLELFAFVKSLCPDAVISDRTVISPKELDVYVPSKKFGIEYDGLYWHSDDRIKSDHAVKKSAACEAAGVRLLRVFEDEWRDKRQIVESMIRHRLGLATNKVAARKCSVRELTTTERRTFIDANHIDGDTRATVSWGLFNGDMLVAALSLRRPFHKTVGGAEVARFCTLANTSVQGALSRLIKHACSWARKQGHSSIMTYVDARIGRADGYTATGFKLDRTTSARFWWTDYVNRYDRFKFRADSAAGVSEAEVARNAGVVKIWGCGNTVLSIAV